MIKAMLLGDGSESHGWYSMEGDERRGWRPGWGDSMWLKEVGSCGQEEGGTECPDRSSVCHRCCLPWGPKLPASFISSTPHTNPGHFQMRSWASWLWRPLEKVFLLPIPTVAGYDTCFGVLKTTAVLLIYFKYKPTTVSAYWRTSFIG